MSSAKFLDPATLSVNLAEWKQISEEIYSKCEPAITDLKQEEIQIATDIVNACRIKLAETIENNIISSLANRQSSIVDSTNRLCAVNLMLIHSLTSDIVTMLAAEEIKLLNNPGTGKRDLEGGGLILPG